jgi:hypothetical protein
MVLDKKQETRITAQQRQRQRRLGQPRQLGR